ncbi:MAG TPA: hypothetical protein VK501_02750 [Baekduia sp.]|uniref:hypothetical protein n=1 Tax=Baekduia sp. TaxID=2600305 RepID=UPI002CFB82F5|nr:hypothetical protein [Baekduia sp.]HMJ32811.1 hypothetical protein [Baekduia sp.]
MTAFVTAGAGFLLAVLWFDLMFDVQVVGHRERDLPEDVLASISGYYARVTTAARPMNRLVAAVMLATVAAIVVQIARDDDPAWAAWVSLVLAAAAILLAATHTLPNAVRLGSAAGARDLLSRRARAVFRDHVLSATAIAALLVVQLATYP